MTNPDTGATDKRKNDEAWAKFFSSTDALAAIAAHGYCYITAAQLHQVTGREPRLLAKLDTLNDRPKVFRDQELTIFPVKNGEYVLFQDPHNKTYFRLSDEDLALTPKKYRSKAPLEAYASFPGLHRLNESQALDFALLSSLLREFTGDADLHLVIRGRTFSGAFQFGLPQVNHRVCVNSVQIEVDGGYESREAIYLVEAKTGRRQDFNIRQLYYPYLEWTARAASRTRKRVVPIFFYITNGKFYFYQFRFDAAFGDMAVERAESYAIDEPPLARIDLADLLSSTTSEGEPPAPFPQANDLDKVVDLMVFLDTAKDPELAGKAGIAQHFEFDERQSDYYANAAAYLGLLARDRRAGGFTFTKWGELLVGTPSLVRRTEILVEQMARRPVFRDAFRLLQGSGMDPEQVSNAQIEAVITANTALASSTPARRASTVRSWLRWLKKNAELI